MNGIILDIDFSRFLIYCYIYFHGGFLFMVVFCPWVYRVRGRGRGRV